MSNHHQHGVGGSNNRVGDWDVDDLLFWRALEQYPPLNGILRQVLSNGWTLCIPPDTAIPLGGPTAEPRPTESFARMHVLVPSSAGDGTASDAGSSSGSSSPHSGGGTSGSGGGLAASFAKAASFFTSFGSGSSSSNDKKKNIAGESGDNHNNNSNARTSSSSPVGKSMQKQVNGQPILNSNNSSSITRFYAAGRKDAPVFRKPTSAIEEDDDELIFEDEEAAARAAAKGEKGAATTLRSICKRHRFNDDKTSRDLASADLGVLVAEGPAFGGMRTVARIVFEQKVSTESRRTVTFLVLDRALNAGPHAVPAHLRTFGFVGQTVSDAVEFLFDADSEFVSDEQSLFTRLQKRGAEVKVVIDEQLTPIMQKIEAEQQQQQQHQQQQQRRDGKDDDDDDHNNNDPSSIDGETFSGEIQQSIDQVHNTINQLVQEEHQRWKDAIVPAAYPLSCRRLDRSFFVALSCYVHSRVYQALHALFVRQCAADVASWKSVRAKFDDVAGGDDDPVHLGLAPQLWAALRKFDVQIGQAVQKAVDSVGAATNPFDKIQRLDQVVCAAAQMPAGAPKLTADDVVPLLAYYLLRSPRCELLPVHLSYVRTLANEAIVGGVWSSHEYSLATLEVAMSVANNVFEKHIAFDSGSSNSINSDHFRGSGGGIVQKPLPGDTTSQTRFEQSVIRSTKQL